LKDEDEYKVSLDIFEGPLDLLLYLINRSEMEITSINVSEITAQYLTYLDVIRELNLVVASDYLSMAATLVRLKAREMLPQDESEPIDEEEEGIFNKQQLLEKLLEYKKYKEAAHSLRVYEDEQFGSFTRGMTERIETPVVEEEIDMGSLNIFDLISAFQRVLERAKEQTPDRGHVIQPEDVKLDDRIERVLQMVEDEGEVKFEDLFADNLKRLAIVVTFMAILELVKMKKISFRQEENFGMLFVSKRSDGYVQE